MNVPHWITEHELAKWLGISVWDLHRVPQEVKEQALVILKARRTV